MDMILGNIPMWSCFHPRDIFGQQPDAHFVQRHFQNAIDHPARECEGGMEVYLKALGFSNQPPLQVIT
jgi:hypothetical protein